MITQTGTFSPRSELNFCTFFPTDSVLSLMRMMRTMMAGMVQMMYMMVMVNTVSRSLGPLVRLTSPVTTPRKRGDVGLTNDNSHYCHVGHWYLWSPLVSYPENQVTVHKAYTAELCNTRSSNVTRLYFSTEKPISTEKPRPSSLRESLLIFHS